MRIKEMKIIDIDKIFNAEFNKKFPVLSCTAAVFGIIFGVVLQAVGENVGNETADIFSRFYTLNAARSVPGIFLSSFAVNMLIIAFLMFLGFSSVGFIFVYVAPLFKGLGIGSVCSYIYSAYLLKGVTYCALLIFPASVLSLLAIILACNESIQMSQDILRLIKNSGNAETKIRTDLYALRFAVFTVATALSSLIYAVGTVLFFRIL